MADGELIIRWTPQYQPGERTFIDPIPAQTFVDTAVPPLVVAALAANGTPAAAAAAAVSTALTQQDVLQGGDPRLSRLSATDLIATRLQLGGSDINIAVASDSTGNDSNDWPMLWLKLIRDAYAPIHIEHSLWGTSSYGAPTVVNAGVGTPESGGVILTDTFTRSGEMFGSTTDNGKVWNGSSGAWTADGNVAKAVASGRLLYDTAKRDVTVHAVTTLVTTGTAAAQRFRVVVGSGASGGGNHVFAEVTISTAGAVTVGLWKVISNVSTLIGGALAPAGIASNSAAAQNVVFDLAVQLQNVTLTVTVNGSPTTITGTISETEYTSILTHAGLNALAASPGLSVDSITLAIPVVPASYQNLKMWNGSVAGTTLQYQLDRLTTMYPAATKLDALIVTTGHNYGQVAPAAFATTLKAFLDAFAKLHPETLLVLASQNPQFAPSTTIQAHKLRQAEVRLEAARRGAVYIPAFERFTSQNDGGASLVGSDGIHPTTPPAPPSNPIDGFGATLWAKAWNNLITARLVV